MASGGRKRKTLPQVPQVRVTTPDLWQYADAAAARAASGCGGARGAELDRLHRAAAADVGDHRVLGGELLEPAADQGADLQRAGVEGVLLHLRDRAERRGAGDRVAAVGAAEAADVDGVHQLGAAGDAGERQAAGDALGRRHQVGHDALVVAREPRACAAEAGLDLVGDEDDAVARPPTPTARGGNPAPAR